MGENANSAGAATAETRRVQGEFLAHVSHEVRTPLNAIIGFADLMFRGKVGAVSADHKEYLGDILESSRHLLHLIDDVLDIAKLASDAVEFRREPTDLGRVVAGVREMLRGHAESKRIRVDTELDVDGGEILLDRLRLEQVLRNYLSNALSLTPEDGRVVIRVGREGREGLRIEVEDAGRGIGREDADRIFGAFQKLEGATGQEPHGTGLELAVAKRLVEAQGGRVGVRSEPGKGSTFWAVLPREPGESPSTLGSD